MSISELLMIRLYLDTCAWINLICDKSYEEVRAFLLECIAKEKIEILYCHAVDDEIKTDISNVPKRYVPAGCFIIGYCRLGAARLGDPDGVYKKLTADLPDKSKSKHSVWDAIHYATAHFEKVDVFVTDDRPLKRKIEERISAHRNTMNLLDAFHFLKAQVAQS